MAPCPRMAAGGPRRLVHSADGSLRQGSAVADCRGAAVDRCPGDRQGVKIGQGADPGLVLADPGVVQDDAPEAGCRRQVAGIDTAMGCGDGDPAFRIGAELGGGIADQDVVVGHGHNAPFFPAIAIRRLLVFLYCAAPIPPRAVAA